MNPVFSDRADPALQSRKGEFPKIRGTYKGSIQGVLLGYDKGSFKGLYKGFEFPKIRGTLFGFLIIRILLFRVL